MSDRADPRLRELTFRLIGMAPPPPDYPEEPMTQLESGRPSTRRSPLVWVAAAAAVILIGVGVPLLFFLGGDGTVAGPTTTTSTTPTTIPPTTAPVTTDTTVPPTTDTSAPPTTATTTPPTTVTTLPPTTSTTLAGEPFDFFFQPGDVLAVVGVAHDDVLNVRAGPGTDQPVIATLEPTADDVVATGQTRLLPESIWTEVVVAGDLTGWASVSFLGYLGGTDDVTAQVLSLLEIPKAETMLDLGLMVAEALASDEPPSRIRMSVAPSGGDLGEVTYDVVGIGDDSVLGFRLHVFGMVGEGGEAFDITAVEQTVLCGRGVSGGLCV